MSDRHDSFLSSLLTVGRKPPPKAQSKQVSSSTATATAQQPVADKAMQPSSSKKRPAREIDFFDDLNQPSSKPLVTQEDMRKEFTDFVKSNVNEAPHPIQREMILAKESKARAGAARVSVPSSSKGSQPKASANKQVGNKKVGLGVHRKKDQLKPVKSQVAAIKETGEGKTKTAPARASIAKHPQKPSLTGGVQRPTSSSASLHQSSIRSFYPKNQPEILEKRYAGIFGIEPAEEEWDSEDEAFIASEDGDGDGLEDSDGEEDWREEMKKITRYDPRSFAEVDRGDDRAMEASRKDIEAEERRSRKLAQREDAEAEREERERQRRKLEGKNK